MIRQKVLSITKDDCEFQAFRAGGPGGQKQNKTSSACRVIHHPSGAVGIARDTRSWHENRILAFGRMARSPKFKIWINKLFPAETFKAQPYRRFTYKSPNISLENRKVQERD